MRPILKKILISKISWLAFNALWIVPLQLVDKQLVESVGMEGGASTFLFWIGFIVVVLYGVLEVWAVIFVLGEVVQWLVTMIRLAYLVYKKLVMSKSPADAWISDEDIVAACRSFYLEARPQNIRVFRGEDIHPPIAESLTVSFDWFDKFDGEESGWTLFYKLLGFTLWLVAFVTLADFLVQIAWMSHDVLFVVAVLSVLPAYAFNRYANVRFIHHPKWKQGVYERITRRATISSIHFEGSEYRRCFERVWDGSERSDYLDAGTIDHRMIHRRLTRSWEGGNSAPIIPSHGSIWKLSDVLIWSKEKVWVCNPDRLPYPVVFRDAAHQLPPSGVYKFTFGAPADLDAASLSEMQQMQVRREEYAVISLILIKGTPETHYSELARLNEGGSEDKLLDSESFLYFLRFADHYDWKCKKIKKERWGNNVEVTFYIRRKSYSHEWFPDENFNWNAAEPGYEFNEIEVDLWENNAEE